MNIGHVQITLLYIYYNSQVMTKVFSLYPLRTMNVSTIRDIKLIVRYRDYIGGIVRYLSQDQMIVLLINRQTVFISDQCG